jgi:NAD(P)-dependent dehydrogenase (short-subunit alcohol dehydrogenase family)
MVELFGATSTTEDVLFDVNLHSKRILVTGVSAGLGVETAGRGARKISGVSEGVRAYTLDPNTVEALWKKSEQLVGESF